MKLTRIVYLGTAEIAVPAMQALAAQPALTLAGVISQPDRPSGRKRVLTPSPVKTAALALEVPVHTPENIGDAVPLLEDLRPDLMVVFAYGQYIPTRIFDFPPMGSINFHPSLLPRYRGASPIQSALAAGDTQSGLSVIRVGKAMDAGDILLQEPVEIGPEENAEALSARFAQLAADLVPKVIACLREPQPVWTPQDPERVTECRKLSKADGLVDWQVDAQTLHNRIRAYQPWPGAYFPLGDGMLKIHAARVEAGSGQPGEVLDAGDAGPLIACGADALRLLCVQPPGKTPMSGGDFLRGHALQPGVML